TARLPGYKLLRPPTATFRPHSLQKLVALRMRDDRDHAASAEFRENLRRGGKAHHVWKLHQQVLLLVDRVLARIAERVLDIFETQVEIAAGADAYLGDSGRDLTTALLDSGSIEGIVHAGVRRRHDAGSSRLRRHFHHLHAFVQALGTIVEPVQNMRVN